MFHLRVPAVLYSFGRHFSVINWISFRYCPDALSLLLYCCATGWMNRHVKPSLIFFTTAGCWVPWGYHCYCVYISHLSLYGSSLCCLLCGSCSISPQFLLRRTCGICVCIFSVFTGEDEFNVFPWLHLWALLFVYFFNLVFVLNQLQKFLFFSTLMFMFHCIAKILK